MPKQGVTSMFRFGGIVRRHPGHRGGNGDPDDPGKAEAMAGFPPLRPEPRCGTPSRGVQLYPSAAPRLARKLDANRADALLIAAYGLAAANYRAMAT